ncbi:hypothetical protein PM082_005226 [Marasmius tenuissimus]|nr:hypothetical protein PM082_005226 [Marasmius tenuissimus]
MDSSSTNPPPPPREPSIAEHATPPTPRRSYPAIVHFAVLSAVILPLALIPYMFTRRQLTLLRQAVRELETSNKMLRKDLTTSASEIGKTGDDIRRMRALLHELMEEAETLRMETRAKEASQKAIDGTTQSTLQNLVAEARNSRSHGESLRTLGTSLADIAAFIHEMELRMPLLGKRGDRSRVEQMRQVALKLQNLPCEDTTNQHHSKHKGS